MKFSQRIGLEPIKPPLQIEEINTELRSTLWNIFYAGFLIKYSKGEFNESKKHFSAIKIIWFRFLKRPVDDLEQYHPSRVRGELKEFFFKCEWNKLYEFFEYFLKENFGDISIDRSQFQSTLNFHLEENYSGFRMIDYKFVPLTNQEEIQELENLKMNSSSSDFNILNKHLNSAITLMSDRIDPDYRNSIKESISMVEALVRKIYPNTNTLGKALSKLKDEKIIDSTLLLGFEKIYGYTNGKDGIRHAILENNSSIDREDAQYFLVSCSAFTNYLIEKARRNKLI